MANTKHIEGERLPNGERTCSCGWHGMVSQRPNSIQPADPPRIAAERRLEEAVEAAIIDLIGVHEVNCLLDPRCKGSPTPITDNLIAALKAWKEVR